MRTGPTITAVVCLRNEAAFLLDWLALSDIIRRVDQIVRYRTVPYVGSVRILDLDAAGEPETQEPEGVVKAPRRSS